MSKEFKSFLQGLLQKNPAKRMSWPALLDHPFVKLNDADKEKGRLEKQFYASLSGHGGPRSRLSSLIANSNLQNYGTSSSGVTGTGSKFDSFGTMNIRDGSIIGSIDGLPHNKAREDRKRKEDVERQKVIEKLKAQAIERDAIASSGRMTTKGSHQFQSPSKSNALYPSQLPTNTEDERQRMVSIFSTPVSKSSNITASTGSTSAPASDATSIASTVMSGVPVDMLSPSVNLKSTFASPANIHDSSTPLGHTNMSSQGNTSSLGTPSRRRESAPISTDRGSLSTGHSAHPIDDHRSLNARNTIASVQPVSYDNESINSRGPTNYFGLKSKQFLDGDTPSSNDIPDNVMNEKLRYSSKKFDLDIDNHDQRTYLENNTQKMSQLMSENNEANSSLKNTIDKTISSGYSPSARDHDKFSTMKNYDHRDDTSDHCSYLMDNVEISGHVNISVSDLYEDEFSYDDDISNPYNLASSRPTSRALSSKRNDISDIHQKDGNRSIDSNDSYDEDDFYTETVQHTARTDISDTLPSDGKNQSQSEKLGVEVDQENDEISSLLEEKDYWDSLHKYVTTNKAENLLQFTSSPSFAGHLDVFLSSNIELDNFITHKKYDESFKIVMELIDRVTETCLSVSRVCVSFLASFFPRINQVISPSNHQLNGEIGAERSKIISVLRTCSNLCQDIPAIRDFLRIFHKGNLFASQNDQDGKFGRMQATLDDNLLQYHKIIHQVLLKGVQFLQNLLLLPTDHEFRQVQVISELIDSISSTGSYRLTPQNQKVSL